MLNLLIRRQLSIPYVFLDGIWLKRYWAGEVKNVSILVAIGVDQDGYRHVLGVHRKAPKRIKRAG